MSRAHEVLERWAARGEDREGRDDLDRIRAAFDAATPVFAPAAERWRGRRRELSDAPSGAGAAVPAHEALAEDLSRARAEAQAERTRAEGLEAELDGRMRELAEAAKLIVRRGKRSRERLERLAGELEVARRDLAAERTRAARAAARLEAERRARSTAEAEREEAEVRRLAVLRSTSWRLTGPLRAAIERTRRQRP